MIEIVIENKTGHELLSQLKDDAEGIDNGGKAAYDMPEGTTKIIIYIFDRAVSICYVEEQ